MFKKIFIDLCNKNKESPSSVCKKVGIAPATFSCWTDDSVPRRATLQRIADYFGVTVNYLLGAEQEKKSHTSKLLTPSFPLTPHETAVVIAYRNHPNEQPIIDKILDVPSDENNTQLYNIAYFGENGSEGIISIPKDEWERLKNLPTTDQNLS